MITVYLPGFFRFQYFSCSCEKFLKFFCCFTSREVIDIQCVLVFDLLLFKIRIHLKLIRDIISVLCTGTRIASESLSLPRLSCSEHPIGALTTHTCPCTFFVLVDKTLEILSKFFSRTFILLINHQI